MKKCSNCGVPVDERDVRCPACGAGLAAAPAKPVRPPPPPPKVARPTPPAVPGPPPAVSPPAPPPRPSLVTPVKATTSPPPPGPVQRSPAGGPADELQRQAAALELSLQRKRRGGRWMAWGAALAVLAAAAAMAAYYRSAVGSYAQLADELRVERDPADPERLTVAFRVERGGLVGFQRKEGDRETELLDRAAASEQVETLQWRWRGVRPGDEIRVRDRSGWLPRVRTVTVPDPPARLALGDVKLTGQVVSATSGQPVAGATVRVPGTRLKTTTGEDGRFELRDAPSGAVPLEAAATGYAVEQWSETFASGEERRLRVSLSPGMAAGQVRFVLNWGAGSLDLDAHLEGPLPDGERFHVFHKQKGDLASREFVNLDIDDRDGEGPETITVLGVQPGRYSYFVHDADVPNSAGDGVDAKKSLAESQVEVKVYQGGQTYRFRPQRPGPGNLWRVCDLVVDADGRARVESLDRLEFTTQEQEGLYAKRTQANREEWIVNYGGNKQSERAVAAGLDWLARHQAEDGHWGHDCLDAHAGSRCAEGTPCRGAGQEHPVAQTGLAILAFQAGGHYYNNRNTYSEHVERGLRWLAAQQLADGALCTAKHGKSGHAFMYEHGIAAFALNEANAIDVANGRAGNGEFREAAERALRYLERIQHKDGGWRYTENVAEGSDMSVTGWQVLAIKSGKEARLSVSPECIAGVEKFLGLCRVGRTGRTAYTAGGHPYTEATTGVGMLIDQLLLENPESELVRLGAEYLAKVSESSAEVMASGRGAVDYYFLYNATLAMYQHGEEPWKRWNDQVRERLISLQVQGEACDRGSWPPQSRWCGQGGRVYSTALGVLTLEVYYRYQSEKAKVYSP
ncbi:MAG: carboxypeptidase-like regulatory domain-containing protein [Pirellulales bacterium]